MPPTPMLLTSPLWLLALLPWSATAAYLMLARSPLRDVPFLRLWREGGVTSAARRRWSRPPAPLVFLLLAALAGIVAAAGPAWRRPGGRVTVILDAGASMSATDGGRERFRVLLDAVAADAARADGADRPVRVVVVPVRAVEAGKVNAAGFTTSAGRLAASADAVRGTALATDDSLRLAARRALADGLADEEAVLVLSDRPLSFADARITQVSPAKPINDLSVASLAVRRTPSPQAMVRITRTGSAARPADVTLRVSAGGVTVDRKVPVPAGGASPDVFVPLQQVGPTVTAELLDAGDDFPADDRAAVAVELDWPRIEAGVPVGDLRRLLDLYAVDRPPGDRSTVVRLVARPAELGNSAGVVVAAVGSPAKSARITAIADHPIARAVPDWSAVPATAATLVLPSPDWKPILTSDGKPVLAVRETVVDPASGGTTRQVWSGLAVGGWSNRPEYVAFWTAVLDWVGGANESDARWMRSLPLPDWSADWSPIDSAAAGRSGLQPGLYRRAADGVTRAFGPAATVAGGVTMTADERAERVEASLARGRRTTATAPLWIVAGLLLAAAGAAVAPRCRSKA